MLYIAIAIKHLQVCSKNDACSTEITKYGKITVVQHK